MNCPRKITFGHSHSQNVLHDATIITVLIECLINKCFFCAFFFLEKCFLVLFFHQNGFFFIMMARIVYRVIYRNFLIVPNFFASLCLAYYLTATLRLPLLLFTIIATLNVARRLEGYRCMLGWRNIAANDIVCPVLVIDLNLKQTLTHLLQMTT